MKTERWIMSRNTIIVLIYHRHKLLDIMWHDYLNSVRCVATAWSISEPSLGKCPLTYHTTIEELFPVRFDPTLYSEALIRYLWLPRLGISSRHLPLKIAVPTKQGSAHRWKFSKVHIGPRFEHGFQPSICIRLYNKIVQATSRSHIKSWEWTCSH
jgi:hypothetical protein